MKSTLPENEYSFDAASIYCDLDKGSGTAIDGHTTFAFSHNTRILTFEGEPRDVLRIVSNIVYDHPDGQLLICPNMGNPKERREIIHQNLPLLRLQFDEAATATLVEKSFDSARELVRSLFAIVDAVVTARGPIYSKQPISVTELDAGQG